MVSHTPSQLRDGRIATSRRFANNAKQQASIGQIVEGGHIDGMVARRRRIKKSDAAASFSSRRY
jgi:hypothetical protein